MPMARALASASWWSLFIEMPASGCQEAQLAAFFSAGGDLGGADAQEHLLQERQRVEVFVARRA
jgi:hypothetical protein